MDFPAEDLELAVLVGVPYPKPTAKLKSIVNFYDAKFQRGWEYAVEAPTRRKLMQAIGRLIRSETDRGVAVVLDARARRFRDSLPDMKTKIEFINDIASFFAETKDELTRSGQPAARTRATSGST
jgi:DNA excision repair protein ERCC-2